MDPQLCREQLEQLINEETSLLGDLEQLLGREHEILQKNELSALETASDLRQERMGALLRIQDERGTLLRMHGYSADGVGIDKLLAWCDPKQQLRTRWSQCLDLATRCRRSNDRNAALVSARMQRVEGLLEVIVGPSQHAGTYSSTGGRSQNRSGAMFAGEA